MKLSIEPAGVPLIAVVGLLPMGTAVSAYLTWSMFGNVYGGGAFLGLFVVGIAAENVRQKHSLTRQALADAEAVHYIARLREAARESGVDLSAPPWTDEAQGSERYGD
ncbi:hypothetical protein [Mycolicibacterium pallens]|uniref:Uncharacterized protein n=1 Tax=Mycolicibacterium pallens TaxID=370524 RepID=A0ABX8VDC5_9MYCO|nr:hypothetical protein [Mycolicibacterium pallens]QYL15507.1 hypothetical protein K0O64_20680 [Mycolicibacterium pallens]